MDKELYYSHKSPENLYADLKQTGFIINSREYRNIGGEEFLWVTVKKA